MIIETKRLIFRPWSESDAEELFLLASALTDKIDYRETFMKGIDYSYYYEQED